MTADGRFTAALRSLMAALDELHGEPDRLQRFDDIVKRVRQLR